MTKVMILRQHHLTLFHDKQNGAVMMKLDGFHGEFILATIESLPELCRALNEVKDGPL